jgi:flagellar assembly factor FliW
MNEGQAVRMVTDHSAVVASQMAQEAEPERGPNGEEIITTRFGKIAIRRDNPVTFSKGMLGMPEYTQFCLLPFPVQKFSEFRLLQSLEEHELSFITLPVELENGIIDRADIETACRDLGYGLNDLALLLVVSVHREMAQVRLSVNARAPLILDAQKRRAEQYVLHNNKYEVRHMIAG